MNRDAFVRLIEAARAAGVPMGSPDVEQDSEQEADLDFDPNGPADDGNPMGTPEAELSLAVDVSRYLGAKREAMRCHRSQIEDTSFFLQMPDDVFAQSFGTEWFIEHDGQPPVSDGWLFPDR
jgi:LmbE family N-acetylglucosaminyl deacetylase